MANKFFGIVLVLLASSVGFVFADGDAVIIRQLIKQCEQSLGVRITINQNSDSDYRSERRQAELMANMSSGTRRTLYNNAYYLDEMDKYDNLPRSQKVNEFERIIKNARRNGSKISNHLTGDAVDISPPTSEVQRWEVQRWLEGNGVSILNEVNDGINCWHLQLR